MTSMAQLNALALLVLLLTASLPTASAFYLSSLPLHLSLQLSIMQAHVLEQALGSWRGLDLAYAAA